MLSNNPGIPGGEIPEETAAHKAGLRSEDLIRSVNGTTFAN
jgi:S1-C subfamily serine protease